MRTTTFLPTVSAAVRTALLLPITVGLDRLAFALETTSNVTLVPFANAVVTAKFMYKAVPSPTSLATPKSIVLVENAVVVIAWSSLTLSSSSVIIFKLL